MALSSDEYVLYYVIRGELTILAEGEKIVLPEESFYLQNCGSRAELVPDPSCILSGISFKKNIPDHFLPNNVQLDCRSRDAGDRNVQNLRQAIKNILDYAIVQQKGVRSIHMEVLFYTLLEQIFLDFSVPVSEKIIQLSLEDIQKKTAEYIHKNYRNPLTLRNISEEIGISYYALSRNFRDMFGMNFSEYLNMVRIQQAAVDLRYKNKSITQIAMDNGYDSSSAFSRIFRQYFQVSPREYRKNLRQTDELLVQEVKDYVSGQGRKENAPAAKERLTVGDVSDGRMFVHPFTQMINGGCPQDFLRADFQNMLTTLCGMLPFRYIRITDFFCRETGIYKRNGDHSFSFSGLDTVFDFFIDNRIKPWIAFGGRTDRTAGQPEKKYLHGHMADRQQSFPAGDEFAALLESFFEHIIRRYGKEEVSSWIYEFGEDFFPPVNEKNTGDFFERFDTAAAIIRKKLPQAKIGGGGRLLQCSDASLFTAWKEHQRPDFISFCFFPVQPEESLKTGQLMYDPSSGLFSTLLERVQDQMNTAGLSGGICISEFASSVSDRNYRNDSCYEAAWLLQNAFSVIGKAETAGYWCALDFCPVVRDLREEIFGGPGILTKSGICKPVFYALGYLFQMKEILIGCNAHGIITKDLYDNYVLIAQNCQEPGYSYYMEETAQRDVRRHIGQKGRERMQKFCIANAEPGAYGCRIYRVGPSHGGILENWENLNFEKNLIKTDLQQLNRITCPYMEYREVRSEGGQIEAEIPMEGNEIVMIELSKL